VTAGKKALTENKFDLCLFDLTLPDGSGYDLCKMARERWDIPVIILTACDEEVNVVMGLELGADDYITKPFRVRELIARIKSVLRRYQKESNLKNIIELEDIKINTMDAKVTKKGQEINLTALEYRLLLTFVNHEGHILTRNQLLEGIWDVAGDFVNDNTLTVYIKRLRDKLEADPQNPTFIKTVRGLGYKVGD
jgi:DNA-binding response OmpR family regulator